MNLMILGRINLGRNIFKLVFSSPREKEEFGTWVWAQDGRLTVEQQDNTGNLDRFGVALVIPDARFLV